MGDDRASVGPLSGDEERDAAIAYLRRRAILVREAIERGIRVDPAQEFEDASENIRRGHHHLKQFEPGR